MAYSSHYGNECGRIHPGLSDNQRGQIAQMLASSPPKKQTAEDSVRRPVLRKRLQF